MASQAMTHGENDETSVMNGSPVGGMCQRLAENYAF